MLRVFSYTLPGIQGGCGIHSRIRRGCHTHHTQHAQPTARLVSVVSSSQRARRWQTLRIDQLSVSLCEAHLAAFEVHELAGVRSHHQLLFVEVRHPALAQAVLLAHRRSASKQVPLLDLLPKQALHNIHPKRAVMDSELCGMQRATHPGLAVLAQERRHVLELVVAQPEALEDALAYHGDHVGVLVWEHGERAQNGRSWAFGTCLEFPTAFCHV